MPTVWFALKRSLHCRSDPTDVHDPKSHKITSNPGNISTKRTVRSGCSRSIANLRDVIHGSKRHLETPAIYSPRSIGSSELLNPLTHDVTLTASGCGLKIAAALDVCKVEEDETLGVDKASPRKKPLAFLSDREASGISGGSSAVSGCPNLAQKRQTVSDSTATPTILSCHKCGEKFRAWAAAEAHHFSKHAVTELMERDSSRKIVEIICRSSWLKTESGCGRIDRVLKVHNMQKTLTRFEEYRETVRTKASKHPKRHPRCLADGNELLRFYGTTLACSLGADGSSGLCLEEACSVCRIIRHGFSAKSEIKDGIGVFTTSTSGRAFESIETGAKKKALMICRVIAGRVHRPMESAGEVAMAGQLGFDSLAGRLGVHSSVEELYLLNPTALLPCFVVICKP